MLLLLLDTLIETIAIGLCRSEYIVCGESASVVAVEATKKCKTWLPTRQQMHKPMPREAMERELQQQQGPLDAPELPHVNTRASRMTGLDEARQRLML